VRLQAPVGGSVPPGAARLLVQKQRRQPPSRDCLAAAPAKSALLKAAVKAVYFDKLIRGCNLTLLIRMDEPSFDVTHSSYFLSRQAGI
jgi:hypothetical protein